MKTIQDIQREQNLNYNEAVRSSKHIKNKYELHKDKFDDIDDLMQFILDDLVENGDKKLIHKGIIMYAEQWHELKKSYDNE